MPATSERRKRFTVLSTASKVHTCNRCQRKLITGEQAVSIRSGSIVATRHAGRTCPPRQVERHAFLR